MKLHATAYLEIGLQVDDSCACLLKKRSCVCLSLPTITRSEGGSIEARKRERGPEAVCATHTPSFPQSSVISPLASVSVLYVGFGLKMKNFK